MFGEKQTSIKVAPPSQAPLSPSITNNNNNKKAHKGFAKNRTQRQKARVASQLSGSASRRSPILCAPGVAFRPPLRLPQPSLPSVLLSTAVPFSRAERSTFQVEKESPEIQALRRRSKRGNGTQSASNTSLRLRAI